MKKKALHKKLVHLYIRENIDVPGEIDMACTLKNSHWVSSWESAPDDAVITCIRCLGSGYA